MPDPMEESAPPKPYTIHIGGPGELNRPPVAAAPPAPVSALPPTNQARAEAARISGENLCHQRRFIDALHEFQKAVQVAPDNALYHFRLAYAAWRANALDLVERHAQLAVQHDPRFAPAHDLLGQWYLYNVKLEPALRHSATAFALAPNDPDVAISRAFVLAGSGDAQGAWALLQGHMNNPLLGERVTILYLQIAPRIGREREAVDWALDYLTRHIYPPVERPQLLFLLAGVLDRLGRYDEAFAQARAARKLLQVPYDPALHERGVSARIQTFSKQRMALLPRSTHGSRRPVFIVGMPRSGTSLVEQIIGSHPSVFGAGELEDILSIAAKVGGPDGANYPLNVDRLNPQILDSLAGTYLARINSLDSNARYVTDKMPLNYLELGLIELLFPQARVIHCVRNPLDTCLSCYMSDIAAGVTFARDQTTLAGYYLQYQRLMDHWENVLSLPMLEVRYEDVVSDIEGQARRLLTFLDLEWDDRCLRFYESKRGIATASRDQVRRPLYASSVGRWEHYRPHLDELIGSLGVQANV